MSNTIPFPAVGTPNLAMTTNGSSMLRGKLLTGFHTMGITPAVDDFIVELDLNNVISGETTVVSSNRGTLALKNWGSVQPDLSGWTPGGISSALTLQDGTWGATLLVPPNINNLNLSGVTGATYLDFAYSAPAAAISVTSCGLTSTNAHMWGGVLLNPGDTLNWDLSGNALPTSQIDELLNQAELNAHAGPVYQVALGGGSNGAPTQDVPGVQATVTFQMPDAASFTTSGTGDYIDLWGTTRVWFNIDGTNSAPDPGGMTLQEVDLSGSDLADAVASTTGTALDVALYIIGVGGSDLTVTRQTAVSQPTPCSTGTAGSVTIADENDGADPYNSKIASILSLWPSAIITHN